ncbi:SUKH-4 family immunity protein [Streptomyces sp. NPDC002144]
MEFAAAAGPDVAAGGGGAAVDGAEGGGGEGGSGEDLPHSFVNSSVAHFVETSWRWYWTFKEVKALRFDIEQYDLLDDFLEFAVRLDPRVGSAEQSLWRGFIQSW